MARRKKDRKMCGGTDSLTGEERYSQEQAERRARRDLSEQEDTDYEEYEDEDEDTDYEEYEDEDEDAEEEVFTHLLDDIKTNNIESKTSIYNFEKITKYSIDTFYSKQLNEYSRQCTGETNNFEILIDKYLNVLQLIKNKNLITFNKYFKTRLEVENIIDKKFIIQIKTTMQETPNSIFEDNDLQSIISRAEIPPAKKQQYIQLFIAFFSIANDTAAIFESYIHAVKRYRTSHIKLISRKYKPLQDKCVLQKNQLYKSIAKSLVDHINLQPQSTSSKSISTSPKSYYKFNTTRFEDNITYIGSGFLTEITNYKTFYEDKTSANYLQLDHIFRFITKPDESMFGNFQTLYLFLENCESLTPINKVSPYGLAFTANKYKYEEIDKVSPRKIKSPSPLMDIFILDDMNKFSLIKAHNYFYNIFTYVIFQMLQNNNIDNIDGTFIEQIDAIKLDKFLKHENFKITYRNFHVFVLYDIITAIYICYKKETKNLSVKDVDTMKGIVANSKDKFKKLKFETALYILGLFYKL